MKRLLYKAAAILTLLAIIFIALQPIKTVFATAKADIVQVTASVLNVRSGPGTQYPVVKKLNYGTRWIVYGSSGNWLSIGTNQWIYSSYTKISYPMTTVSLTVNSWLNVRLGPSTGYPVTRRLTAGELVDVLESRSGWYRIDNTGWISAGYTKPLSATKLGWYYIPNSTHDVPQVSTKVNIARYGGYYVNNTSARTVYLTFDLGYENGYTPSILNTLQANGVKAAFFVVKSYIDNYPEYITRMVDEGHIVGNHTRTHPSLPDITSTRLTFYNELLSVADSYKRVTGNEMPKLMRPPMGEYSELSLYLTQQLGYKSIFWSFGYYDWDPADQPDKEYAYNKIISGTHNGEIILLHGVSKTSVEILDRVIKEIKRQGYEFGTLDGLQ